MADGTAPTLHQRMVARYEAGSWQRLSWSILRLLFWMAVALVRVTLRVISWTVWSCFGFWIGYRLAQLSRRRTSSEL